MTFHLIKTEPWIFFVKGYRSSFWWAKLSTEDFFSHEKRASEGMDEPTASEVKSDDRRRKSSWNTGGGPKKKAVTLG